MITIFENLFNLWFFYKKNISRKDKINFLNENNRNIFLKNITLEEAERIHDIIKYYNILDDKNKELISKREPIKIYINSYGGSVEGMFIILDAIKLSKTPVYTINIGTVQKESLYIFLSGFLRYSYPNSTFLYENIENKENNQLLDNIYNNWGETLKNIFIQKTRWTENEYNKHQKNSYWFTANEAQKLYFCNEIVKDFI